MKRLLTLVLLACGSVACALPSGGDGRHQNAVNGQSNDQSSPNDPGDQRVPAGQGDDSSEEGNGNGNTCNDPMGVVPAGWTTTNFGSFTIGVPPYSIVKTDKSYTPTYHIWAVLDGPGGKVAGYVQAGLMDMSSLDAVYELKKSTDGTSDGHGHIGQSTMIFTWSTLECRKDLIERSPDGNFEVRYIALDGNVAALSCDPSIGADVCAKFYASFHAK